MSDTALSSELDALERLVRRRRATRHFRAEPVADALLERLIDLARWAPSGYNLQPTHFVLVTDPATRDRLCPACMGQVQIREAPALVVLTGDRRVVAAHFEEMLRLERESGSMTPGYEALLRSVVPLAFGHGPAGLGWLWKAMLAPVARLFRPVPDIPAVHKRYWLAKQVMLCAMNLMLAAEAAGLATVPMEGFDEWRVRRVLGIPRSQVVPVIVAVGYAVEQSARKTRLPVGRVLHRGRW